VALFHDSAHVGDECAERTGRKRIDHTGGGSASSTTKGTLPMGEFFQDTEAWFSVGFWVDL
jgi:hypothetical protein